MGMPAYIGYYIQHNWGESSYMTFAPHTDSTNAVLEESTAFPTKELRIKYESENTKNGDVIAFWIAFSLALTAVGFWGAAVYVAWSNNDGTFSSDSEAIGYAAGGFFAIFICFFIVRWLLMLWLWPGNVIQPVPSDGEAIRKVNATSMSALGFLSYFFYKLCGKKNQMKQKTAKKEAVETAEIDELINTIE